VVHYLFLGHPVILCALSVFTVVYVCASSRFAYYWLSRDNFFRSLSCIVVGGLAQWLGRRSLAGGLSLIYASSIVDIWPLCG